MTAVIVTRSIMIGYAGIILVFMWGYAFVCVRFLWATLAGWVQVILYEVVAIWINPVPVDILISNNFFFISANVADVYLLFYRYYTTA